MELGKTKAKIERYAKENNVDVQVAWDSFFFDEFLHRISLSAPQPIHDNELPLFTNLEGMIEPKHHSAGLLQG